MKFIIGKKIGMTQVFRADGTVVPVTRVQAGPCVVTQVKPGAVQIGFGSQKLFRLSKSEKGHLKGISAHNDPQATVRFLKDFKTESENLKKGDQFNASIFVAGEKVQVTGMSKGKGFQGVVKRHGFAGGPASHGHKDNLRMPGSIGAGGVQRVFKNMRMGGHMGVDQVTVKNLEVVEVHPEAHELFIKGAVPGARNGLLYISTDDGTITIEEIKESVVEAPVLESVAETPAGETVTA